MAQPTTAPEAPPPVPDDDDTNLAYKAQSAPVHPLVWKYGPWILGFIAFVFVVGYIASLLGFGSGNGNSNHTGGPVCTLSGNLEVPGDGDSTHLPTKPGCQITFTGDDFVTYCVYRDGRPNGIIGDPVHPCVDGPMLEEFVHNKSTKTQIISYAYHTP